MGSFNYLLSTSLWNSSKTIPPDRLEINQGFIPKPATLVSTVQHNSTCCRLHCLCRVLQFKQHNVICGFTGCLSDRCVWPGPLLMISAKAAVITSFAPLWTWTVFQCLNDLRSIKNLFGLASKVHPIPMTKMENRVRKTSLEVETNTRISTVTFFPTYHHLGKWSYCFLLFFCWHWDWVMCQPELKAARHSRPCMAQRESLYLSMWKNCVRVTLDLESGCMRRERCVVLSVCIVSYTQQHQHLDPFSTLSHWYPTLPRNIKLYIHSVWTRVWADC